MISVEEWAERSLDPGGPNIPGKYNKWHRFNARLLPIRENPDRRGSAMNPIFSWFDYDHYLKVLVAKKVEAYFFTHGPLDP